MGILEKDDHPAAATIFRIIVAETTYDRDFPDSLVSIMEDIRFLKENGHLEYAILALARFAARSFTEESAKRYYEEMGRDLLRISEADRRPDTP